MNKHFIYRGQIQRTHISIWTLNQPYIQLFNKYKMKENHWDDNKFILKGNYVGPLS